MSTTQSQNKKNNYDIAMTGEFYVLAQLFQRGYMAALTYGNAKSVDILVSAKSDKMFKLEVKTAGSEGTWGSDKRPSQFGKNYEWTMSQKHEGIKDKDLYYCFVILRGVDELPRFFIVSSQQVAQYVKTAYQYRLDLPGGGELKKTTTRMFRLKLNSKLHDFDLPIKNHENRWDILPK
jgi:hypothetical protein